jgi:hypothetical protein
MMFSSLDERSAPLQEVFLSSFITEVFAPSVILVSFIVHALSVIILLVLVL